MVICARVRREIRYSTKDGYAFAADSHVDGKQQHACFFFLIKKVLLFSLTPHYIASSIALADRQEIYLSSSLH